MLAKIASTHVTPFTRAPDPTDSFVAHIGAGLLFSGKLSNTFSLPQIAFGYGVLALGATLFTLLGARNPHTDATGNSTCDSSSTLDDAATAFNATETTRGEDDQIARPT